MPQSYTLLNNKDNLIQRNKCHLIKMNSNFVKNGNDNDVNNDVEIKPTTWHSTLASEPGKKDEPWENVTELQETSCYITRSGRRVSNHLNMLNS